MGFIVSTSDGTLIGHVIIGDIPDEIETPGYSIGRGELAGVGRRDFWNLKYANHVAKLMVKRFAPAAVEEGFQIPLHSGEPIRRVEATAKVSNPGSVRVLQNIGMKHIETIERYGDKRSLYEIDVPSNVEWISKPAARDKQASNIVQP